MSESNGPLADCCDPPMDVSHIIDGLNDAQRAAVTHRENVNAFASAAPSVKDLTP